MYKIILITFLFISTLIAEDIQYSENPNLYFDIGTNEVKKKIPYDAVYIKDNKTFLGYSSSKKGKIISNIVIEDESKTSKMIDKSIVDVPYVFVSSNNYPFFKIIRGFVYNCNIKRGCYAVSFKKNYSFKFDGVEYDFSIKDFSGLVFGAPDFDNYPLPFYARPLLRNYSFDKNVEYIKKYFNTIEGMTMMYQNTDLLNIVEDSAFIKANRTTIENYKSKFSNYVKFGILGAVELRKIKVKKFGKSFIRYANKYYIRNILNNTEPVFAVSFDKKGAQDIANYMCRHGFKVKMAKENSWDWEIVNKHPESDNQLYKCKNPLSYYMQDDKLWKKFAKNAPNGPPIAFLSGHLCRLTSGHP